MAGYTKQIRTTEEDAARFDKLATALNLSQGDTFELMLSAYEASRGAEAYPSESEQIKTVQRAANTILQTLLAVVAQSEARRDEAEAAVKNKLVSKDETILELQNELKIAQSKIHDYDSLRHQFTETSTRLKALTEDNANLRAITQRMADPALIAQQDQKIATLEARTIEQEKTIQMLWSMLGTVKPFPVTEAPSDESGASSSEN